MTQEGGAEMTALSVIVSFTSATIGGVVGAIAGHCLTIVLKGHRGKTGQPT